MFGLSQEPQLFETDFCRLSKSLTAADMARRAYSANQDMDPYRRSGRSAIQVHRPYAPVNHSQPAPRDPSDDGADNSPRRRIALACQRCRKRKIKCSGDEDGKGCMNCQHAGNQPGICQFLRVNSTKCVVGESGDAWNFSTTDSLISNNVAIDRAGGSVGGFPMMAGTGGPRSSFGQGQIQNQAPFNIPSTFPTSPTRLPDSYLNLHNQDPYDPTIQVPAWQPTNESMRSESSNYQFMNPPALSSPSGMELSPFVALGSGRTLPCPNSLANQTRMLQPINSIPANQGLLGESNASTYPSYSSRSSSEEWGICRGSQVSTGLMSPSAIGSADRSSTRASASDQVSRGNDLYNHLAPSAINTDTALTRFPSGNLTESSTPAAATLMRLQPNTSYPIEQPSDTSPEFSYTHSSYPARGDSSRNDNTLGSEGTLGGFEPYSPLPQLQQSFPVTSRRASNEGLAAHRPATLMSTRS